MSGVSKEVRRDVYKEAGISQVKRNPRVNLHHLVFKSDVKRGLVPKNFNINGRENLIPLPIETHNLLHKIVEETPEYRKNIDCRIWLGNMAYNDELDLL